MPDGLLTPLFIAALREIIAATTHRRHRPFLRARRLSVEVSYAAGLVLTEERMMLSLKPADCILMMSVLVRPCWA